MVNLVKQGTFDRLSTALSKDERLYLLGKLQGQLQLENIPLYNDSDEAAAYNLEAELDSRSWVYRLWLKVLKLFSGKEITDIFRDKELSKLGKKITQKYPRLYDSKKNMLLNDFNVQLTKLKDAARFFLGALDSSVNQDKGAFYAFLGSIEMEDMHNRLMEASVPEKYALANAQISEIELKNAIGIAQENIIGGLSVNQKDRMYDDARLLNCLQRLAAFPFEKLILRFINNTCFASRVRELLAQLNNILFSLRIVPPESILEALFAFVLQEYPRDQGFDIDTEVNRLKTKTQTSLNLIREFNQKIPMTLIIRAIDRNLNYAPTVLSGGEDWFALYRDYWRKWAAMQISRFVEERKQRNLEDELHAFFDNAPLKHLQYAASEETPEGLPMKREFSLAFLRSFYALIFLPRVNRALQPIILNGEFLRRENRLAFTESYNSLVWIEESISALDISLSPGGEQGIRYAEARGSIAAPTARRALEQRILEDIEAEANRIIVQSRDAMEVMVHIIDGILKKDSSGKFDALGNFPELLERHHSLLNDLTSAESLLQQALKLLHDIEGTVQ